MQKHSGFLNINKPVGCTSHDVVAKLRKVLGIKKIGHGGTLDPFASGVLIIGINEATRLFEYLPSDKSYIAEITFGIETDTDDITGKITNESNDIPTLDQVTEKIKLFTGDIKQKPPIYSAINIKGERAYKLARKNQISLEDIKEKEVSVYSIEIISFVESKLKLRIHCSAGTYIRSIARDLGKALNTLGTLSFLQRVKAGNFNIEESINPESSNLPSYLIVPEKAISLAKIHLNKEQINDIYHGKTTFVKDLEIKEKNKEFQLLDNNNILIAIGFLVGDCIIRPKKVFMHQDNLIYGK